MLACRLAIHRSLCSLSALVGRHGLTTSTTLTAKQLPPRPKLEDTDITENFVKGTGPGGQKINKTASAVQLIHHPTGIVIKCQATRSRIQNRKIARTMLAERLELAEKGDESRLAQKAELAKKRKASATKKSKRKYRKLAEDKDTKETAMSEAEESSSSETALEDRDDNSDQGELKSDTNLVDGEKPSGHDNYKPRDTHRSRQI